MPGRIRYGERIGTVVGIGKGWNQLKVVVAFDEREKSPFSGEFIIVEEIETSRRRLVCFVEEPAYGDYSTTESEREKHLVDQYMRDISGAGSTLSEEEKRALFFRVYYVRVLGELKRENSIDKVVTVYRFLPELTAICRYPVKEEYETILSAGIERPEDAINIGKLAIGDEVVEELKIKFDKNKFITIKRNTQNEIEEITGRRTAILARTGFGKSNLCKVILYYLGKMEVPVLISDLNGEYAFSSLQGRGLADIPGIREKLVVFTNRRPSQYEDVILRPLKIDFSKISTQEVSYLLDSTQKLAGVKQFQSIKKDTWKDFITQVYETATDRDAKNRAVDDFIDKEKAIKSASRDAVAWRLKILLQELHEHGAPEISREILYHLASNLIVVVDLSLIDIQLAHNILGAILSKVFEYNKRSFTTTKKAVVPCITVLEEAQNVLSPAAIEEESSVFVKYAKEGRKYGLSLVYITQQPGSVDNSILSQTDNYFVMHLLNNEDIKALVRANVHYNGIVSRFLQSEALQGNTYIYSSPYQPYIFPAKIEHFDELIENELKQKRNFGKHFYVKVIDTLLLYTESRLKKEGVKVTEVQQLLAKILKDSHPMVERKKANFFFTKLLIEDVFPTVGLKGIIEKHDKDYVWKSIV